MSKAEKKDGKKDGDPMKKLNKKILKNIILEVLNEQDAPVQKSVSSKQLPKDYVPFSGGSTGVKDVDKIMSKLQPSVERFLAKMQKVAPAELAQIDDVPEVIQSFLGLMDVLSGYNLTDLNKSEKVRTFVALDLLMPKLRKLLSMKQQEGPETEETLAAVQQAAAKKQQQLKQQQLKQQQGQQQNKAPSITAPPPQGAKR